jgi:hypothetical protein
MVKDRIQLENNWNIRISWAEYFRLRAGVGGFIRRVGHNDGESVKLGLIMDRGKPRCSKLRKMIEGKRGKRYRDNDPKTVPSLTTLWGVGIRELDRSLVEWNLTVWTISFLAPKFKDFCFRILHGRLYLNLALSHFSDTNPGCTFCLIRTTRELKRENIGEGTVEYNQRMALVETETNEHLLWSCRETQRAIRQVLNDIAGTIDLRINRKKYLEGVKLNIKTDSLVLIMLLRCVQYGLYKCRNRRTIPLFPHLMEEVNFLRNCLEARVKWRESIAKIAEIISGILE